MPSAVELRDGDLLLRPWRDGHAEAVGVGPGSDGEVGRYFGMPFGGFSADPDPSAPWFAIVADGVPVGRIWFAAHARPFEVGYFLLPDAWGRGLATRALILVRDWMAQPLVLCTHPRNVRSQRVAERAGFRRDGVVENYAQFKDGETSALRFVYP
ncbi:MAG TPA: GNAT family N-acetyltransferase [Gaiellaceae bacterium]|nr:GNAT family N-acetyltransferase [Gaiellaceae bacterium]